MTFGKHRGERISEVPASYLLWLYDEGNIENYPEVLEYVENNKEILKKEALAEYGAR